MLEAALVGYRGTVLLVSHDRYLRERVADRSVQPTKVRKLCYSRK